MSAMDETILSLCPKCLSLIPGTVEETNDGVFLKKTCPEHGPLTVLISPDMDTYRGLAARPRNITTPLLYGKSGEKGCPDDCGLCPSHDQHTCLAILEITSRCDLNCPVCLASSLANGRDLDVSTIEFALRQLIKQEGRPTPLQLSGGEPTLHKDLLEIVRRSASLGFTKIELNTNGIALSHHFSICNDLKKAGLTGVYLQMDGLHSSVSKSIRAKDLVGVKKIAIENCKAAGLQVVLSVTVVPGVNDHLIWEMIQFGVQQRITGINFQSLTLTGRYPKDMEKKSARFTLGHFMRSIETQSGRILTADDINPIPCPDPRCGSLTYALIHQGELMPLNKLLGSKRVLDFCADFTDWQTVMQEVCSTKACDCRPDALSEGASLELSDTFLNSDFFSIGYHGMMDGYSFDLERARRCCIHELMPDGSLIPFCLYNIKYRKNGLRV